jgi:hypothetical protein
MFGPAYERVCLNASEEVRHLGVSRKIASGLKTGRVPSLSKGISYNRTHNTHHKCAGSLLLHAGAAAHQRPLGLCRLMVLAFALTSPP